jgi:hypothetical protein
MKENSQFQENERLRHIEKRKMKKVENQLLRTELENERLAHEKLKKYKKTKDQLHTVETHVEFLEGALLSSKETRISARVSETFHAKVKLNEKTFYSFFGMTIALFESLLLSVTPIYNDTTNVLNKLFFCLLPSYRDLLNQAKDTCCLREKWPASLSWMNIQ